MRNFKEKLLQVKPDEWPAVVRSFTYFFLLMMSYYILKPVRESLFVTHLKLDRLPWVHIVTVPTIVVVASIYDWLLGRFSKLVVVPLTSVFFAANLALFRLLFVGEAAAAQRDSVAIFYYVWVSIFSVFTVMVFWSVINHAFVTGSAARVYGVIGAGGAVGGLAGGVLTAYLVKHGCPTESLLLIAGALLVPCAVLAYLLLRDAEPQAAAPPPREPARDTAGHQDSGSGWKLLVSNPYVLGLFIQMLCGKMTGTILDLQFKSVLKDQALSEADNTWYMSVFQTGSNAIGIVVQLFLVARLQTRFGPLPGLVCVPALSALAAAMVLAGASLMTFLPVAMLIPALIYSLHQASRELLYVPTSPDVKFRAKTIIDTFGFRNATALASLVMLAVPGGPSNRTALAVVVIVLCAASIHVSIDLDRRYRLLRKEQETKNPG